jgi:hypothetical protein
MRTNDKRVVAKLREHVLDGFGLDYGYDTDDKVANLKDQIYALRYTGNNNVTAAKELVMGGKYLVYYADAIEFLNKLGLNDRSNVKGYTDQQSWDLYVNLLVREIVAITNE